VKLCRIWHGCSAATRGTRDVHSRVLIQVTISYLEPTDGAAELDADAVAGCILV
jgi:hypothetical protein